MHGRHSRQQAIEIPYALAQMLGAAAGIALALARGVGEGFVASQPQNLGQDLLALRRSLGGEQVGAALQQQRRVDECLVAQPQQPGDGLFRLGDRVARDRPEPVAIHHGELERSRAGALAQRSLANDAIDGVIRGKLEFYLHLGRAMAQQVVLARGAAAPPERPGHGVDQRRFAVAVAARQAGKVNSSKVQVASLHAVAEEVAQVQAKRYHALAPGSAHERGAPGALVRLRQLRPRRGCRGAIAARARGRDRCAASRVHPC